MSCVRKRGNSWNAQVRVSGWRSFTKSFNKKTDAITWSSKLEHQLRNTSLPEENIQNLKLSYLMNRYAEEVSCKIKSGITEQCQLRLMSQRWIGDCKVVNLTKSHFEQYREDRLKEVKSGTVKAELTLIQRVYKTAIKEWGYGILVNPVANIELPKSSKPRTRRLLSNELSVLISNAAKQRNKYISTIIQFAVETGMRRSEILKLTWKDMILETGIASLYDTKNGDDRHIPLTKTAIQLLSNLTQSSEFVFPISANCLRLAWERCRKKSNIKGLRFHDLRHEAVSRFFEMGLSVPEVALISGHKDVRQLFRYTHLKPENLIAKYSSIF
ncbi:site-specific integrase [Pseudomonadota bacterium]|nr:site-specific integrase [Pseudomonadota bacterium]